MKTISKILLIISSTALLSACSGGGFVNYSAGVVFETEECSCNKNDCKGK